MATRNLAWMPTLSYDTQAVLATDKVRFQGQEVACVIADDPYIAKDACEAIDVDYEPLPAVITVEDAVKPGAPAIWDEAPNNVSFTLMMGNKDATEAAFASAKHVVTLKLNNTRITANSIEPKTAESITCPAVRTTNMSPSP